MFVWFCFVWKIQAFLSGSRMHLFCFVLFCRIIQTIVWFGLVLICLNFENTFVCFLFSLDYPGLFFWIAHKLVLLFFFCLFGLSRKLFCLVSIHLIIQTFFWIAYASGLSMPFFITYAVVLICFVLFGCIIQTCLFYFVCFFCITHPFVLFYLDYDLFLIIFKIELNMIAEN